MVKTLTTITEIQNKLVYNTNPNLTVIYSNFQLFQN